MIVINKKMPFFIDSLKMLRTIIAVVQMVHTIMATIREMASEIHELMAMVVLQRIIETTTIPIIKTGRGPINRRRIKVAAVQM